jgi:tetratricopeptide (TPR) repeat protein
MDLPSRTGAGGTAASLERAFTSWQADLTPIESSVLAAASLQGSTFDAAMLAELECLPANQVWRCLVDLSRDRGIVRLRDVTWEFRTPLLVPFWRARHEPQLRRKGHRRIAARLRTHCDPDPLAIGEQLALAGDRAAALPEVLQAAREAIAGRDAGAALHALELVRDAPEPASEDTATSATEILCLRAEALQLFADWDAAVEVLERALLLARAWGLGGIEIQVLRRLGSVDYERSRFEEAVARYRDARTAAEARDDVHALHEIDPSATSTSARPFGSSGGGK